MFFIPAGGMRHKKTNHIISGTSTAVATVLIAVALAGGSSNQDMHWTYAKLKTDNTLPSDCVRDFSFGLVEFQTKFINCGDQDSETTKSYSEDGCKTALQAGSVNGNDLCDTCEESGISIQTLQTGAVVAGILAFVNIVCRYGDDSNDTWKRIFSTGCLWTATIFSAINLATWGAGCHEQIKKYISDVDNVPPFDGTDTVEISTGFILTIIGMFFAFVAAVVECNTVGGTREKEHVDLEEHEVVVAHHSLSFARKFLHLKW
uniref:Uncharacterized protein n=1 Tax=Lotharella globosa TaxID=91324 RepID=A0A7S3YJQ3_9EUKA